MAAQQPAAPQPGPGPATPHPAPASADPHPAPGPAGPHPAPASADPHPAPGPAAAPALDRTKLLAARYRAATDRPYLASALYALTVVESHRVPTMGVDRHWRAYVSPAFVAATPVAELAAVWLHEVAHLLRDHHGRADRLPAADQHDRYRVNVAQDCEINDDLIADGLPLPAGRVEPRLYGLPEGRMFEEYVTALPPDVRGHDCGSGAHGQPSPWDLTGPEGPARIGAAEAQALRRTTAEAMRAHLRGRGTLPGGWQRWAERVLEPAVDWRRALAGAVREAAAWAGGAVDYTYRRPSRRSAALRGVVLPSLRRPLPRVAVVVDTSGSMGDAELAAAMAEVTGVLREVGVRGNRVTVLACDAAVQAVTRVACADEVRLGGGGGTDLRVGIEAALARPERPGIVVVLTDGLTPWPDREPSGCRIVAALIGAGAPQPPAWVEAVRVPLAGGP
ncbi:VWA-like domain-containing protein [Streptomyces sp. NPDC095602]|uniref:vWA domain-containing protein n=1 Tax=Streptomyces sp. NPDC095602 TaxID=3155819 RepID=UPI00331D970E